MRNFLVIDKPQYYLAVRDDAVSMTPYSGHKGLSKIISLRTFRFDMRQRGLLRSDISFSSGLGASR